MTPPPAEWTFFDGTWSVGPAAIGSSRLHALWMGSSVFDGARWFDGHAPDLDAHCARLNRSAHVMGLTPLLSDHDIAKTARDGLDRFAGRQAIYVRPAYYAERGTPAMVVPDPASTRFVLTMFELPMPAFTGSSLTLSPFRRPAPETMPTDAKAGCLYPNGARAIVEARARGFDGALLCDMFGNVAETATSNIFMVREGVALTPALNGTFLPGITRARIIALLRTEGVEVVEQTLRPGDFACADEIFSTGNFAKVAPVTRFEDRSLPIGPVTERARALYLAWAASGATPALAVAGA